MPIQRNIILWSIISSLSLPIWAHTPAGLKRCMDIDDADERVACYDTVMETTESNPAAAPVPPDRATKQTRTKTKDTEEKAREITASITRVTELARGNVQISLDNGQVWRENRADRRSSYKVGDRITITQGSLGSHRLKSHRTGLINKVHQIE